MKWLWPLFAAMLASASGAHAERRIALTFDDAPRQRGAFLTPDQRTVKLIAGLKRAGVRQAAFFVTPGNLSNPDGEGGEDRILAYVAAGHVIANHTMTHPHLSGANGISADAYIAEIDQAAMWLKEREGYRPWFRYPFLDEGGKDKEKRDAVRAALKQRHLKDGYATVDGSDWTMETNARVAMQSGKAIDMQALHDLYVETLVGAADYYDELARRALGRSPAHVLVLHETDLAALWIADVVNALRRDGWTIISADEAYADQISALQPQVPSAQGTLTELLAWEKGLPPPRWYDRDSTDVANALFAERVLHERPAQ